MRQWMGVSIGLDNGLSPIRQQAIILTNAGLFVNWILKNKLSWNFDQNTKFCVDKNASENTHCEKAVILFRGGGGKWCAPSIICAHMLCFGICGLLYYSSSVNESTLNNMAKYVINSRRANN